MDLSDKTKTNGVGLEPWYLTEILDKGLAKAYQWNEANIQAHDRKTQKELEKQLRHDKNLYCSFVPPKGHIIKGADVILLGDIRPEKLAQLTIMPVDKESNVRFTIEIENLERPISLSIFMKQKFNNQRVPFNRVKVNQYDAYSIEHNHKDVLDGKWYTRTEYYIIEDYKLVKLTFQTLSSEHYKKFNSTAAVILNTFKLK